MIRTQILLLFSLCVFVIPRSLLSAQTEKVSKPNVAVPDLAAGKRMFERHCSLCHGIDGKGGRGPNLNRAQLFRAPDDTALMAIISDGIPPEMPEGWFFSEEEVANIAAYVRSFGKIPTEPLPGDPARGAVVFSKNACARCHLFAAAGFAYGPELTDVGVRRSPTYVRTAIVAPAERLPEGFLFVRATTSSKFALSTQLPESCVGNSSFIPLRGLECFPPRAVSSFPVPMKAISTRSMREPENRCGTFNPAAPSAPIPSPSMSMDTSASPSVRTRCSTFSVCEAFGFLFVFMTGHFVRALTSARKSFLRPPLPTVTSRFVFLSIQQEIF